MFIRSKNFIIDGNPTDISGIVDSLMNAMTRDSGFKEVEYRGLDSQYALAARTMVDLDGLYHFNFYAQGKRLSVSAHSSDDGHTIINPLAQTIIDAYFNSIIRLAIPLGITPEDKPMGSILYFPQHI